MTALTPREFANELTTMVARRRAMWDHPFAQKIRKAALRKEQLRGWIEQQFYLTGKVHDIMGPLYVNCEDAAIRAKMLENLLEEETGKISGSAPHPELFIRLGTALGSTREAMLGVRPLPETLAMRTWWLWVVQNRGFVESLAALGVAVESQTPGAAAAFSKLLEEKYGLTHEETAFFWVHDEADKEHGGGSVDVVAKMAATEADQAAVRDTVDRTLDTFWRFYDGLDRVYGVG